MQQQQQNNTNEVATSHGEDQSKVARRQSSDQIVTRERQVDAEHSKKDPEKGAPAVKLDMDLDVDIELKAKIQGDVTLAILDQDTNTKNKAVMYPSDGDATEPERSGQEFNNS